MNNVDQIQTDGQIGKQVSNRGDRKEITQGKEREFSELACVVIKMRVKDHVGLTPWRD